MSQPRFPLRAALQFAALVALLVAGTTMPGGLKADIEGQLWHGVPWSALAHFILFAMIARIPIYGAGWPGARRTMIVAIGLALITETLQAWVPGRHPLVRDGLIDIAGAGFGLLLRSVK